MLLTIPTSVSQEDIESLATALADHAPGQLELPLCLKDLGILGLESRLIHLIVQWARSASNPTLVIPKGIGNPLGFINELCLTAYGLTAIAIASRIETSAGAIVPQQDVQTLINKRLDSFKKRNSDMFLREEGFSALSVFGHSQEFDYWLFPQDYSVDIRERVAAQVSSWFEDIVLRIVPVDFIDRFDTDRIMPLAKATFELLENTYLHGRRNEYAEPLKIGVCGVSVRLVKVPYEAGGVTTGGRGDVNLYFMNRLLKDASGAGLFFEVTVFDSGIGYHRWINAKCNDHLNALEYRGKAEGETVRACLLKHASSKSSDGSGVGLSRVTRILKSLFGFVRIRTGKTCFYARLDLTLDGKPRILGGDHDEAMDPDINLQEWFPGRELSEAHGTSLTFCIPLTRRRK